MQYEYLKLPILDFFKDLRFEEKEHKYFVNGKPLAISVSGKVGKYKPPFDEQEVSSEVAERRGVTQYSILEEWETERDRACTAGNITHLFGEAYTFNRHLKPKTKLQEAVVKFWADLPPHIVPVMVENIMYHKKFMFAGTADILLYNLKTKKYIIADYKTNKDLFKVFVDYKKKPGFREQRMLAPFSYFLSMPINHYQLQLSYYQILLEQVPGIEIESRKVIWLHTDGTYEMYATEDLTSQLKKELALAA